MTPFVSCLCPTFGRFPTHGHLLGEAVWWFLEQDHPADRRELLILNDAPEQELRCDSPGVYVLNLGQRVASLAEKLNLLAEASRGSILLRWDDDDVSLPGRLTQAVARLGEFDYWNPRQTWYEERGVLVLGHRHQVCQNASAWKAGVGLHYREGLSGDEDLVFDRDARARGRVSPHWLTRPEDWTYIYRWGVSPVHLSGAGTAEKMRVAYATRKAVPGVFTITPAPTKDYVTLCRQLVTSWRVASPAAPPP